MTLNSRSTAKAARNFNRRTLLKHALGVGAVAVTGPWIVQDAFSSSGEVNILCWSDYLPDAFLKNFEKSTGIIPNYTEMGSNGELINKMKASKGRGFDIIAPSVHRRSQWAHLNLTQAWDLKKIPNLKNVHSRFVIESESWIWGGGQHHLPHIWGTEGIAYRTDLFQTEYGKLSFGDLWLPEMKGSVQGRPHSMMAGIGQYLTGAGKLPPLMASYKDETSMREIWDEITKFAIEHKPWIKSFWNNHQTQKTNFLQNDCMIGQTWDGPAIELMKDKRPIQYLAPKEGAFAWLDGLSMPIGAKNKEQAHKFVNAIYTAKSGAQMANSTGYNATVMGVRGLLDSQTKAAFDSAYPGDAFDKLWWWPDEPDWYVDIRSAYRDQFIAA